MMADWKLFLGLVFALAIGIGGPITAGVVKGVIVAPVNATLDATFSYDFPYPGGLVRIPAGAQTEVVAKTIGAGILSTSTA